MPEKETPREERKENRFPKTPQTVTEDELEDLGGESLDGSGFEGETPDRRFA